MELIRRFGHDRYVRALGSWSWLEGLDGKAPVLANLFGDVFLKASDGSIWFLDTVGGRLDHAWADVAAFQAGINTTDAQSEYLMVELAQDAAGIGLTPGAGEILSFRVPPVLGGEVSPDNLEVADFVVSIDIAGQIHGQVASLPPGTPISGITIS